MVVDNCAVMVDAAAIFFNQVRIQGWFHAVGDTLANVSLFGASLTAVQSEAGLPHAGVQSAYGDRKGFVIQALLSEEPALAALSLVFTTVAGKTITVSVADLSAERETGYAGRAIIHEFIDMMAERPGIKLLDIGGRARSGVDRTALFPGADCTVLDVLPGDNVDVVGDAHQMAALFPPGSFDAMFSSSVFEHLLMPWVVAAAMGKVLKPGGVAFIATHQTIGMHDQPWDFWRFSDTAWDGLFNHLTGFKILKRALENPQYIVPHFASRHRGAAVEAAVGFLGSCVLVRKIGEPLIDWGAVETRDVIASTYPDTFEPPPP